MAKPYWPAGLKNSEVLTFKCSPEALEEMIALLSHLSALATAGVTLDFMIGDAQFCFDGGGKHDVHEITVNGLPLKDWHKDRKEAK